MDQDPLTPKALALRVLSIEETEGSSTRELAETVQRIFDKLHAHLSVRLGNEGYRALLKRSFVLASKEFRWIASLSVTEAGVLEGVDEASTEHSASETTEGFAAVLASFIGLLDVFIGKALCLLILNDIWSTAVEIETKDSQGDSNG